MASSWTEDRVAALSLPENVLQSSPISKGAKPDTSRVSSMSASRGERIENLPPARLAEDVGWSGNGNTVRGESQTSVVYNQGNNGRSQLSLATATATLQPPNQKNIPSYSSTSPKTPEEDFSTFSLPLPPPLPPHFYPPNTVPFSYNTSTPMPPPTPPRPPGRAGNVAFLREKLEKALNRRRAQQSAETDMPESMDQRPESKDESVQLTHASTHSRSQSGISTPPTQHSNNQSPVVKDDPHFTDSVRDGLHNKYTGRAKGDSESDWETVGYGSNRDSFYDSEDGQEEYTMRPTSSRAVVRPMEPIQEESGERLTRRIAYSNLNVPTQPEDYNDHPHSSDFDTTFISSHAGSDLPLAPSERDRQALASFDFGLFQDPRLAHLRSDGRPDSFGSNYVPSDEEEEYEEIQARNLRSEADEDVQVGIQSSYLTDDSFAAAEALTRPGGTSSGLTPNDYPSIGSYMGANAEAANSRDSYQMEFSTRFTSDMLPPPEDDGNVSSLRNTVQISGPNAIASGPVAPAMASSTVLGNPSVHSGPTSTQPSRMSSYRTNSQPTTSSSNHLHLPPRTTSGSARGRAPARPPLTRTSSYASYFSLSTGNPDDDEKFMREMESQLRRLSKISSGGSSEKTSGGLSGTGIAVVVMSGDGEGGSNTRTSVRGSIEIISPPGSKVPTPMTFHGSNVDGNNDNGTDEWDDESSRDHSGSEDGSSNKGSDEEVLLKSNTPQKLLPGQKLQEGVKIHPADERYQHVYRMRETFPDAAPVMVPVYRYPSPGSFPNRNALSSPIAEAKHTHRTSNESNNTVRTYEMQSLEPVVTRGSTFTRGTMFGSPGSRISQDRLVSNSPQSFYRPPTSPLARPPVTPSSAGLRVFNHPKLDDQTMRRMAPRHLTLTERSKSPSQHVELPRSPTIQEPHPALRPDGSSTPKLRLPASNWRLDEESGQPVPTDPELVAYQQRISRTVFFLSCLFPPFLLVLAYGGLDALVQEVTHGKVDGIMPVHKRIAKWVGWGLAIGITAAVGGGVIGAVLATKARIV